MNRVKCAMLLAVTAVLMASGDAFAVQYGKQASPVGAAEPGEGDAAHSVFLPIVLNGTSMRVNAPIDGSLAQCSDFVLDIGLIDIDIPDPGWVWVNPAQKFRSVTGAVTKSEITHTDFPAAHDSHDQNTDILVDAGQEDILSDVGKDDPDDPRSPDTLELEWEIGVFPTERGQNAPERTFPKWAWPNIGDRVWANGHWIFDCGHPTEVGGVGHFRTEIHPMRAIASLRDQVRALPGTGTTPVPITAVDLYIHGRAGMVMDILECGPEVMIDEGTCSTSAYPHRGTPIDENFEFDVHLPPKPFPSAVLATFVEDGPGNSVDIAPILTPTPAADPTSVHVQVPLAGSGVTPDDVYARKISVGWVYPPDPPLRRFKLTLNRMDLHEDHETDPGDCECTFFWMNVDRAPDDEWIRLVDFAQGNMNDYDDDGGFGDGEMDFSGAAFDFYVRSGQTFNVRAHGYDQDCLDDYFGDHDFSVGPFLDCYLAAAITFNAGDNDDFAALLASFGPPDYGVGAQDRSASGEYELEFTIEEMPLDVEDAANLVLTKVCKPDDVALAGQPITCTIVVENPGGPGLPRSVVVDDILLTDVSPGAYTVAPPTFTLAGSGGAAAPCGAIQDIAGGVTFRCEIGTAPIGGSVLVTTRITSTEAGDFNNLARLSSASSDPDLSNNEARDSIHVRAVADLAMSQSGSPDPAIAGASVTYTLQVANGGPSTAVNALVKDALSSGVRIRSVSAGGGASCNAGVPGDPLRPTTCAFDSLAPSASETMTIVVDVLPEALGPIHNDAWVQSDALDTNNANDLATTAIPVSALADLAVSKTTAPASFAVSGQRLTYAVTVANAGPSLARNVVMTDTLPDGVQMISTSITGAGGGVCTLLAAPPNAVACHLGDLAAGASAVVYLDVRVEAALPDDATIVNSATASSSAADPNLADNTAAISTPVHTAADLEISKTSDADVYQPSSTVQYIIIVTNHGASDAQDVVVVDNLPDVRQAEYAFDTANCAKSGLTLTCSLGSLPAGSLRSFNVYVRIKGSQGEVVNSVAVASSTLDPDPANNTSTWTVLIRGGL